MYSFQSSIHNTLSKEFAFLMVGYAPPFFRCPWLRSQTSFASLLLQRQSKKYIHLSCASAREHLVATAKQRKDGAVAPPSRDTHMWLQWALQNKNIFYQSAFSSGTGNETNAATVVMWKAVQWYSLLRWISVNLNGGKDCRDAQVLPGSARTCTVLLSANKGGKVRFIVSLKPQLG